MMEPRAPSYDRIGALVIGVMQLVIGVALICLHIPLYTEKTYAPENSIGFWTGAYFIICGALSIYSWKEAMKIQIVVTMTFDIIGSLVAGMGIIVAALVALLAQHLTAGNNYYHYESEKSKQAMATNLYIAMSVLCFVELVICIVGSALCCRAVCCGQHEQLQVVFVSSKQGDHALEWNKQPDTYPAKA